MQHSDFHGIGADIIENRRQLGLQKARLGRVDCTDSLGVLCGEGRDCGQTIAAERCNSFEIRLNTSATSAIRACNR